MSISVLEQRLAERLDTGDNARIVETERELMAAYDVFRKQDADYAALVRTCRG